MKCPYCGDEESKVIDSRPTAAAASVCAAACGLRPMKWWRPSR